LLFTFIEGSNKQRSRNHPVACLQQCGPTTIQARGPHVARHSVCCDPRKDLGKVFKSKICWKACEVTSVSMKCLRWIKCILHKNNEEYLIRVLILFLLYFFIYSF